MADKGSEFTKLKIYKTGKFGFVIKTESGTTNEEVLIQIEVPSNLPPFQVHGFNNQPTIKAWGIVKAPSGYGFNVVLVSAGQDDLYGEWRVIQKNMVYPNLGNMQDIRMTPFELMELPSQASRATSGGFRGDKTTFNADLSIPLLKALL